MPVFVVQEHHARKLHYDIRFEMNKKLKSWAVPKKPPLRKGLKRLAIKVQDHALSYATFRGEIKEGYGKGTVKIWDKGTYAMKEKGSGKLVFKLRGKKLKGVYCLIKFGEKNWLLFRTS